MIIREELDTAVRHVVAPHSTEPKDLGNRPLHTDRDEALTIAAGLNQSLYEVTVTVTLITEV